MLGKIHTNDIKGAEEELATLRMLQNKLIELKEQYNAKQLSVQISTGEAWIHFKKGNKTKAEELMRQAADLEDGTMKHR